MVQVGRKEIELGVVLPGLGVILDRANGLLTEADTADELIPVDELLDDHGEKPGPVVVVEQFLQALADVDFLPAAAVGVLEYTREPDVVDHRLPVQRKDQVPETLGVDDAGDVLLVGEHQGLGGWPVRAR